MGLVLEIVSWSRVAGAAALLPSALASRISGAGWADDDQVVGIADPLAGAEVLEERTIEVTGSTIVDVLDGGALTELGAGQARVMRRLSRTVTSPSTRRPSQSAWGIPAASGVFCSSVPSAIVARPRAAQAIDGRLDEHADLLINCINCGRRCWRGRECVSSGGSGPVGAVLRWPRPICTNGRWGTGAGGIDALLAVALDQPENTDGGAEALFRMRPRPQDDVDQSVGVGADLGGFGTNTLMGPVAITAMRARHMLGNRRRAIRQGAAQMRRHPLAAEESLEGLLGDARRGLLMH